LSKQKSNSSKLDNIPWKKLFFELIVVFLGVTAGFLLNDWQLQSKDSLLEQKYKSDFLKEVNTNITILNSAIESDSLWLNDAEPKLLEIEKGTISIDSANSIIKQIIQISRVTLHTSTYENITNSGNFNLLEDYNLRKQIVDYHIAISGVGFIDDYFYQYFNNFVMPFVFKKFRVLKSELDNPTTIKTNQFENVITGYYSIVQQRKIAYEDLLQKSNELQDMFIKND